jgi:hypothetical protein
MEEKFCDKHKEKVSQELHDTKMWAKILFYALMVMGIMFIYMCYWYGLEKSSKEAYKIKSDAYDSLMVSEKGDTILCRVDSSYLDNYYQVSIKDKKIMRILISNGFEMDTTYLEPCLMNEEKTK